jgi:mannitol-1-/sugar-/sorbitol-6-phosphatase
MHAVTPGAAGIVVLADLDGTLIDSHASIVRTYRWWAARHRLDETAVLALMPGRPAAEVVARLAPHLDAVAESALIDARAGAERHGVVALPGARELLTGWPAERLGIVTSCTRPLAAARLRATYLPTPRVVITPERVERGKPDPAGYLLAARELRAAPGDCVVLEDSPAGARAGRAAGMWVVGVLTTHTAEELKDAHQHVRDVAEWLDLRQTVAPRRSA